MSQGARPSSSPDLPTQPPKGALLAIFLIILVDFLGFGLIIPLLPFYVPGYQHNALKVTLLFSIFSICQFVGAPVLGALSDRYGRRPVLIVSQLGSAAGYVLLAIASTESFGWRPEARLALVYLSRVIDGFTGGNVSTAQAYISDVTTSENRAKGMGLIGAAFGIGFCLGPFLGGVLGSYNRTWPAYAAAGLAGAAALQTFLKLPESTVHKPTEARLWFHPSTFAPVFRQPIVAQLLLISFVSMAAFVMMEATIGIFMAAVFGWKDPELAARNTGLFFGYWGLVIVVVQGGLIGRMTRKWGEWRLAVVGPVMVAAGMATIAYVGWAPALWIMVVGGTINSVGRSLQTPTLSSLLSKYSDPREQGAVFGLYHGLSSLARVIGPMIAGLAYPLLRNTGQFWTAAGLILLVVLWTAIVRAQAAPPPVRMTLDEQAVAQAARTEIE
jgi:DHA1 family tetracycline resistance protein-like MFS transporter